jgi:hypothetical protein
MRASRKCGSLLESRSDARHLQVVQVILTSKVATSHPRGSFPQSSASSALSLSTQTRPGGSTSSTISSTSSINPAISVAPTYGIHRWLTPRRAVHPFCGNLANWLRIWHSIRRQETIHRTQTTSPLIQAPVARIKDVQTAHCCEWAGSTDKSSKKQRGSRSWRSTKGLPMFLRPGPEDI